MTAIVKFLGPEKKEGRIGTYQRTGEFRRPYWDETWLNSARTVCTGNYDPGGDGLVPGVPERIIVVLVGGVVLVDDSTSLVNEVGWFKT